MTELNSNELREHEMLFYFCMATIVISSLAIAIQTHFNGSNHKLIQIEFAAWVALMTLPVVNLIVAFC